MMALAVAQDDLLSCLNFALLRRYSTLLLVYLKFHSFLLTKQRSILLITNLHPFNCLLVRHVILYYTMSDVMFFDGSVCMFNLCCRR